MDKSKGQRTRDEILQASARLFSLHGYHNTSTADILAAVSLSKGAFYHHFRSKQDLAQAILEQLRREYQQKVIDPVNALDQLGDRPEAMINKIVELNESNSWFNCLLLIRLGLEFAQQETPLALQVAETINWINDIWSKLLADAQSAGTVENIPVKPLAQMITATLSGAIIARELQPDKPVLTEIAQQVKLLIHS